MSNINTRSLCVFEKNLQQVYITNLPKLSHFWRKKLDFFLFEEDISNIRWAQKLLMRRLLLCNSTTNWKNNSSPRPRILENLCFKDGGIIISTISPLISAASFLKISITCREPRSRQYGVALYPTVLPNPLISALLVTVSSRTDHELFAKK